MLWINTGAERASPLGIGPSVTRDNPGQRLKGSDCRWSRHERLLDAVDLTEYAGDAARVVVDLLGIIGRVAAAVSPRTAAGFEARHSDRWRHTR